MAFFETEFPRSISFKALGGPGRSTIINLGFSGQEARNKNWLNSRRKWTIDLTTPPPSQFSGTRQQFVDLMLSFFEVVGARSDAWRFFDHADHTATNQQLATVNGNVQLVKNYVIGGRTYQRVITKPITEAISQYQGTSLANTVFLTGTTTAVTVDPTTGIVSGESAGTAVDFQFDVPVRFDVDDLQMQMEESASGQPIVTIHSTPIIEVLPPNF
jgi:uncharacterized protein (TIGR02217 family)